MTEHQLSSLNACIQQLSIKLEQVESRFGGARGNADLRADPASRQGSTGKGCKISEHCEVQSSERDSSLKGEQLFADISILQTLFEDARGAFQESKEDAGEAFNGRENAEYRNARAALYTRLKDCKARIKALKSQYKAIVAEAPPKKRNSHSSSSNGIDRARMRPSGGSTREGQAECSFKRLAATDIESNPDASQDEKHVSGAPLHESMEIEGKQRGGAETTPPPGDASMRNKKPWWKRIIKGRIFFWKKSSIKSKHPVCQRDQTTDKDVEAASQPEQQVVMQDDENGVCCTVVTDSGLPTRSSRRELALPPLPERGLSETDELEEAENGIATLTTYGRGLVQDSEKSLKRSVSTVDITMKCASDTMTELQDQRKSLERVHMDVDRVQDDLKISKTIARSIRRSSCDRCHVILLVALGVSSALVILNEAGVLSLR